MSPEEIRAAHAAIAAGETALAAARVAPLTALADRIEKADLRGLAADLRALKAMIPREDDQRNFENIAITVETIGPLIARALKMSLERANVKPATGAEG